MKIPQLQQLNQSILWANNVIKKKKTNDLEVIKSIDSYRNRLNNEYLRQIY